MVFESASFACASAVAHMEADMLGWWNRYRVGASKLQGGLWPQGGFSADRCLFRVLSLVTWCDCAIFFSCLLRLLSNVVKWLWARDDLSVSLYEALFVDFLWSEELS